MRADRNHLEELARVVAEGGCVDWETALAVAESSSDRRAIQQLRAVEELAHATGGVLVHERTVTLVRDAAGTTFSAGQVLGQRYRIQSLLGRGGMGEVWYALDLKLRVDVALKSLHPKAFANERALELLRREVRSAREVISPNVCRIFDLIEIDGQELVSMEYIDGETLLQVLHSRGPLELREGTEIASQFLAGLTAIHSVGLVHRDIKPENIMLTRSGRVVLMDFGLAKQSAEDRPGSIAGTPAYMAPEQLRGEGVDARADIFAAGIVLAEMTDPAGPSRESRSRLHASVRRQPPGLPEGPWASVLRRAVAEDRERRHSSAHELMRTLEEVALRVEGAEDLHPYPGLGTFTENDAEYFFGRELEIESMWKKLRRPHLLALIGPSGAGKSSFLRAGLIPAKPAGWQHLLCHPGDAPLTALARAFAPELAGDTEAIGELVRFEDPDVAVALFSRWRKQHDEVLLIVDQFEELFTLNPPDVQTRFAELLGRLALEGDVHVLLSMRDDFLFYCHEHPALLPILSEMTLLGPPVGSALRRALIRPALKCGYQFEDEKLIAAMLEDVSGERGALPLLAFAVSRLWQERDRDKGLLTHEAYARIGGVGGALAQHAEATVERIGRDRLPLVRELFRNLVTAQGTRAARDADELLSIFDDAVKADAALRGLIDARLLTSFEYTTGEGEEEKTHRRVEIIHESLITAWPRLVRWRTQDEDSAQQRDQLRQVASMWDEGGHPEDLLWTGTSYKAFEVWRERYAGGLTATEEAFAGAMKRQNERRRRQRRLAVSGAFVLLLAVLAVVGTLWRQSVLDARRAEASKLLALGENEIDEHPTATLAYATASLELADTPEARLAAIEALWRGPTAFAIGVGSDARSIEFSPNGEWFAAGLSDEVFRLWKRDGSLPLLQTCTGYGTLWAAFSADNRFVACSGAATDVVDVWSLPEVTLARRLNVEPWGFYVRGEDLLTFTRHDDDATTFLVQRWPLSGGDAETIGVWRKREPWGRPELPRAHRVWKATIGIVPVDLDYRGEWVAYAEGPDLYLLPLNGLETAPPRRLGGGGAEIIQVVFHPDGERIATLDASAVIRLWSRESSSREPLRTLSSLGDLEGTLVYPLRFDRGGRWMGVADCSEKRTYLWDLTAPAGAEPLVLNRGKENLFCTFALAFDPTGSWVAVSDSQTVSFWPLGRPYPHVLRRHDHQVQDLAFTPQGDRILYTTWEGSLWHAPLDPAGDPAQRRLLQLDKEHPYQVVAAPSGDLIAVFSGAGIVVVPPSGESPRKLDCPDGVCMPPLAFDAAGRTLAAVAQLSARPDDCAIRIWDLHSGETRALASSRGGRIASLGFTPDGRLVSGGDDGIRVWNLATAGFEQLFEGHALSGKLSPDGRYLLGIRPLNRTAADPSATADRDERGTAVAFLLDLQNGTTRDLESHGIQFLPSTDNPPPGIVAWHPSSEIVITSDRRGVIRAGSIDGSEPHLLLGHEGPVLGLDVHPNGDWIGSAGADRTLRLWPMPESRPLQTLPHDEFVEHLRSLTNYRVIADTKSATGYRIEYAEFPGWEELPTW